MEIFREQRIHLMLGKEEAEELLDYLECTLDKTANPTVSDLFKRLDRVMIQVAIEEKD